MLAFYYMGEFELIRTYFQSAQARHHGRTDVVQGPGDDCALLDVPAGCQLAVSTDTLVSGVHFFADGDPYALGHKALAVNLSDLAAMGADARWVSLALTLPAIDAPPTDAAWVEAFANGFLALASTHQVALVGGDMTRGPLSMTVSVKGTVPTGQAILRRGAKLGDDIYVTGHVGEAALALQCALGHLPATLDTAGHARARLDKPTPRLAVGRALRGIATSALDISDGLVADLGHILHASQVGAEVDLAAVPYGAALLALPAERRWQLALAGGDDYELCFTASPSQRAVLAGIAAQEGVAFTRIGQITAGAPVVRLRQGGQPVALSLAGWEHF
ncbi:MAG: thiamine-phosphate kinase [Aeromonas sp.]